MTDLPRSTKKIFGGLNAIWRPMTHGHRPILILLALGLLVGAWVGRDYGVSTDEQRNAALGSFAIQAYSGSTLYYDQPSLDEHGPVYFMIFATTSQFIHQLAPAWTLADGRHLTNYLMFLLAVGGLYFLALRFVSRQAAWFAAALFASQPLLFGQAFINQKDIPFLSLSLLSIAVGLIMADGLRAPATDKRGEDTHPGVPWWSPLRAELKQASLGRILLAAGTLAAVGLVSADLLAFGLLKTASTGLISSAYAGHAPAIIQIPFDRIATDAYKTPLTLYLDKFAVIWFAVQWIGSFLLAFIGLLVCSLLFPHTAESWGCSWRQALDFQWSWILMGAAIMLGLTICVRQLGVFVGLLISLYALYRGRARMLVPLAIYWVVALGVTIATWPYLWPSPISRFVGSLFLSAHFPNTHVTFYRGEWFRAGTYPWYFFPNLAGIELTEPAVALILLGLVLGLRKVIRRSPHTPQILLLGGWFGGPLIGLVFFHMTTYGNITHLLFILPAFFLFGALGLEAVLDKLRRRWLQVALLVLCLLPGIWGIINLHPYEYIYINSFAGGVSGAAGFYELDRACLSIREAIEDVDQVAAPDATVMLPSSYVQAEPFARPDLRLIDDRTSYDQADYVINCTWIHGLASWPSQDFSLMAQVKRGRAVLANVWQRIPGK